MASNDRYINIGMGLDIQDLRTGLSEAKREMALAESEFKARTAGLDKWDQSIDGVIAKLDQMAKEMQAKEKIVQAYRAELQRVTEAYGENSRQAQEVQTKLNNAEASYTKAQKYTETLKQKLNDLRTAEANAGAAADGLKTSVTSAGSAAKTASDKIRDHLTDALDKVKDSAEKAAKDGFDNLKSKVSGFVTGALSKATNALKDFIKQTVQLGIDFTSTMSTVQALSGASAEEMAVLEKAARDAGASTTFSATEAAEALKYMSLAGWDAQQSTEALGGILDLAAASGMGLAEASDAVTDYLSAFGLEAADAAHMADLLAYAQAHANTSADQLIAAYKNSAVTLAANGQSVETVTALLSKMADQGLKGSEAGTALNAVMRDLSKRMKEGAIQIGNSTVMVKDQEGNYRNLADIIGDVATATASMTETERSQAVQTVFTTDSLRALNILMKTGADNVHDFEGALKTSNGAAKTMAETMQDNLGGDLKTLNSTLDEIKLALFELIEGPLREIVKALTEVLKHSGTVTDGVAKGFGNVTSKFEGASKGIDAIANADWDGIAKGAEEAWNGMTESFSGVGQWAGGVWEKIKGAFSDPVGAFRSIAGSMLSGLKSGWDSVTSFFSGVWDKVKGAFSGPADAFRKAGEGIYSAFTGAWNAASSWAGGVLDKVRSALSDPLGTIKAQGERLFGAFKGAWSEAASWAGGVLDGIKSALSDPAGAFKGIGSRMLDGLKSGWSEAASWAGGVWEQIKAPFSGVGTWFSSAFAGVTAAIKAPFEGIYNWLKTNVVDRIVGAFRPVLEFFGVKTDDGFDPLAGMRDQVAASEAEVKRLKSIYDRAYAEYQAAKSAHGVGSETTAQARRASDLAYTTWNAAHQELVKLQNGLKDAEAAQKSGAGGIGGIKNGIEGAFSGVTDMITKPFTDAWNTIKGVFGGVYTWFKTNVVDKIAGVFQPILSFFGIGGDAGDPLADTKRQIAEAEKAYKEATDAYNAAYQGWTEDRRHEGYGSAAERSSYAVYTAKQAAYQQAKATLDGLKKALADAESKPSSSIGGIKSSIEGAFSGVKDVITKPFTDAWNTITGVFSGIGDWFSKNVVKPIQDALKPVGQAVSGGVVGGMADAKKGITTGTQTLGGWIVGGLCDVLGIHSPSKVMHDRVGLMIGAGVAEGIADSARSVRAASEALGASVSLDGRRSGGQAMRGGPATVVYNQTINSPDPLSVGQIYRDTRSLIGRREWA